MSTYLKPAIRPLVHGVHSAIATSLQLSAITCSALLIILLVVWICFYNDGTSAPDVNHVILLANNHGHLIYILRWQRAVLDVIEIMLGSSALVLVPSLLTYKVFIQLFTPSSWGYDPLGPQISKRETPNISR